MLTPAQQLQAMGIGLDQMAREADPDEPKPRFEEVKAGPELLRIQRLPRRPIPDPTSPASKDLAAFLTSRLAKVAAPYPGALNVSQGLGLVEGFEQAKKPRRGAVFSIKVGGGKTLFVRLLMEIVKAQRPLYVCPAANVAPTKKEFMKFQNFWHVRPTHEIMIESYEMLATPNAGEDIDDKGNVTRLSLIERLRPTDVFLDEGHKGVGDGGTTTCSRIDELVKKHPDTRFWILTGTLFVESIKPPAKLFYWALREDAPLPFDYLEREMWSQHLDARASAGAKVGVGCLYDAFLDAAGKQHYCDMVMPDDKLTVIRKAVAQRIYETPGVFGTQDDPLDIELTVEAYYPPKEDEAVEEAFCKLLGDGEDNPGWVLPDGQQIVDAMQMGAYKFDFGQGYFRTPDPMPPVEYVFARSSWARWCRKGIKYNRRGIDSEARMAAAVKKGIYCDKWTEAEVRQLLALTAEDPMPPGVLKGGLVGRSRLGMWTEAQVTYRKVTGHREPPVRAEWISDECIEAVRAWTSAHPRGIVWVSSIPLGEQLAKSLRIPYYGAKGLDSSRRYIEAHKPGFPAIASVKANGTGKNLQKIWSDNLWLWPPGEQSLGRTHRQGQTETRVRNYIYLGCSNHLKSYLTAEGIKARFTEEMQLSLQKIRYADTQMPDYDTLAERGGRRYEYPDKE